MESSATLATGLSIGVKDFPDGVIPSGAVFQAERGISRGAETCCGGTPRRIPRTARQSTVLRDDAPTEDEMQTDPLASDNVPRLRLSL